MKTKPTQTALPTLTPARNKPVCKKVRACRVCGCTELDCNQCIARTGEACHWIARDLCSACALAPEPTLTRRLVLVAESLLRRLPGTPRDPTLNCSFVRAAIRDGNRAIGRKGGAS
jgi:hypothetical protein